MPISAILFGGRRRTTVPLVTQAFDWEHGVFLGSIMASETTAAQQGAVGNLRFDPMAMLPFCGYNMADYFAHWLAVGSKSDPAKLPQIFFVNWFRRDEDGRFLWPGYGENSRVLKWVFERVDGSADAVKTPIGLLPAPGSLDLNGAWTNSDPAVGSLKVTGGTLNLGGSFASSSLTGLQNTGGAVVVKAGGTMDNTAEPPPKLRNLPGAIGANSPACKALARSASTRAAAAGAVTSVSQATSAATTNASSMTGA